MFICRKIYSIEKLKFNSRWKDFFGAFEKLGSDRVIHWILRMKLKVSRIIFCRLAMDLSGSNLILCFPKNYRINTKYKWKKLDSSHEPLKLENENWSLPCPPPMPFQDDPLPSAPPALPLFDRCSKHDYGTYERLLKPGHFTLNANFDNFDRLSHTLAPIPLHPIPKPLSTHPSISFLTSFHAIMNYFQQFWLNLICSMVMCLFITGVFSSERGGGGWWCWEQSDDKIVFKRDIEEEVGGIWKCRK